MKDVTYIYTRVHEVQSKSFRNQFTCTSKVLYYVFRLKQFLKTGIIKLLRPPTVVFVVLVLEYVLLVYVTNRFQRAENFVLYFVSNWNK